MFDRVTGRPVWPIEDRLVPQTTIPGEKIAATQPIPTRPAPFDRQGVRPEELIDFTPELREQALAILDRYDRGPLFTPPSERGTIAVPGVGGGASWAGAAADPATGWLYVTSVTQPHVLTLSQPAPGSTIAHRYVGRFQRLLGPGGLPLFKPPFGRVVAIDLNTGEHAWTAPLGDGPRGAQPPSPRLEPPRLPARHAHTPLRRPAGPLDQLAKRSGQAGGSDRDVRDRRTHAPGVRQDDGGASGSDRASGQRQRRAHDVCGARAAVHRYPGWRLEHPGRAGGTEPPLRPGYTSAATISPDPKIIAMSLRRTLAS